MQIERIEELRLDAETDTEIANLLALCFDTDFGGYSHFNQRHALRLVARNAGTIVGHMALSLRVIGIAGRLVDVIGLGEVATHPAQRGQGIANDLLIAAIAEARQSTARFFILFGNARLYGAAGFRSVGNPVRYLNLSKQTSDQVIASNSEPLMVLALGDAKWDDHAEIDLLGPLF